MIVCCIFIGNLVYCGYIVIFIRTPHASLLNMLSTMGLNCGVLDRALAFNTDGDGLKCAVKHHWFGDRQGIRPNKDKRVLKSVLQ